MVMRRVWSVMAVAAFLSVIVSTPAWADQPPVSPRQERQDHLMEKYGDQGIDADGDGSLTRAEIRAFFAANPQKWEKDGKRARHRAHRRGGDFGPRHEERRLGRLLMRLERLSADTRPPACDLRRFPQADSDGDGELSDQEWASFVPLLRRQLLAQILTLVPDADTNGDSELDDAELEVVMAQHIEKVRERIMTKHPEADADGDGVLSDDELDAFRDAQGPPHRHGRGHGPGPARGHGPGHGPCGAGCGPGPGRACGHGPGEGCGGGFGPECGEPPLDD